MKITTGTCVRCRQKLASLVLLTAIASLSVNGLAQARMSGFSLTGSKTQREIEARFKAIPSPEQARNHHRFLTAEPHPAGSERNNELAMTC